MSAPGPPSGRRSGPRAPRSGASACRRPGIWAAQSPCAASAASSAPRSPHSPQTAQPPGGGSSRRPPPPPPAPEGPPASIAPCSPAPSPADRMNQTRTPLESIRNSRRSGKALAAKETASPRLALITSIRSGSPARARWRPGAARASSGGTPRAGRQRARRANLRDSEPARGAPDLTSGECEARLDWRPCG